MPKSFVLFERSVEVGDVVEVDGLIGSVKKIGLRASIVESRENVSVITSYSIHYTKLYDRSTAKTLAQGPGFG